MRGAPGGIISLQGGGITRNPWAQSSRFRRAASSESAKSLRGQEWVRGRARQPLNNDRGGLFLRAGGREAAVRVRKARRPLTPFERAGR